jgi:hypothetical protein
MPELGGIDLGRLPQEAVAVCTESLPPTTEPLEFSSVVLGGLCQRRRHFPRSSFRVSHRTSAKLGFLAVAI